MPMKTTQNTQLMPVYYISHGGGPWPWMEQGLLRFADLQRCLAAIPAELPTTPRAILMISAHWESQQQFLIQANPKPSMIYDYYGFPEHTYEISYPAAGDPALAQEVQELLAQAGIEAALDPDRGYDHGAYVTGYCMYPNADIPMVQLSIDASYDVATHIALGKALQSLRAQNVLLVASGASYHNLRLMGPEGAKPSAAFDAWLEQSLLQHTGKEREQLLVQWDTAPAARLAHAREDHLVPLFVAVGAALDTDKTTRILNSTSTSGIIDASYRFG